MIIMIIIIIIIVIMITIIMIMMITIILIVIYQYSCLQSACAFDTSFAFCFVRSNSYQPARHISQSETKVLLFNLLKHSDSTIDRGLMFFIYHMFHGF